jgi:hypothetical protein
MGSRRNFWTRTVPPGAYLATAIGFAFFIIPSQFLDHNPSMRIVGWILVLGCVAGAVVGWYFREDGPIANVQVKCDSARAEMIVRNDGVTANFWGTLKIVDGEENKILFCEWTHTTSPRIRIAKGEEYRILLAEHVLVGATEKWVIKAIQDREVRIEYPVIKAIQDGEVRISFEIPDIVLEGSIIAEPDLANDFHFRVRVEPSSGAVNVSPATPA